MNKFWAFAQQEDDSCSLMLNGEIASETWWGDEVTPAAFKADLAACNGRDLVVWINSPGGDVFAASQIYTALMEYKGYVTAKIEGMAASAASVIAMAADEVLMAPTAYMMIHNPWTIAMGDAESMRHEAAVLDEIAEGLVTAYEIKTGMSRAKIRSLMDDETWMSSKTAISMGFADGMLTRGDGMPQQEPTDDMDVAATAPQQRIYASARKTRELVQRIRSQTPAPTPDPTPAPGVLTEEDKARFALRMRLASAVN